MFSFKEINKEEKEKLNQTGTLDYIDDRETIKEAIAGKTNLVSTDLIKTIEENKKRNDILVLQNLDRTSINYNNMVADFEILENFSSKSKEYYKPYVYSGIKHANHIVFDMDKDARLLDYYGLSPKKKRGLQVVKGIDEKHIKYSLNALEQDIVYAMGKGECIKDGELNFLINSLFSNEEDLLIPEFDELERIIFRKHYLEGQTLMELLEHYMKQNGIFDGIIYKEDSIYADPVSYTSDYTILNYHGDVDALNIYNYLVEIKKSIIEKILKLNLEKYQINVPIINIPEESEEIIRIGSEKPTPKNDIYMDSNKVHLIPYEYEENDTKKRTRRGLRIRYAKSDSMKY